MIVIKKTDGSVSLMTLVNGADATEAVAKWRTIHPDYVSHREMPDAARPTDRTFRDAWEDSTPGLVIDVSMPKAREVHKDHLRKLRAPKLAMLDVAWQMATETGTTDEILVIQRGIAVVKQALRDVTADPRIAAAATPEELKTVIPDALK
jgi:hypothetical protein